MLRGSLAGALLCATLALPSPARAAGTIDATVGPLISGTGSYIDGTYVWTDYAYDDTGANTAGSPGGDATYPSGAPEGNAADLIQLQLSFTDAGDLQIRAILETLVDADHPALTVGFDTDGSVNSGAATLPGWIAQDPLGMDEIVTVSSSGGVLWHWGGTGWVEAATMPATVDLASNSLTTVVPRGALDPGDSTWRTVAQLTLALGPSPVYDLGFVRAEDPCTLPGPQPATCVPNPDNQIGQDQRQAAILAGMLPSAGAIGTVDFSKIRGRVTELATATERGFYTFLYYSALNLGEGIRTSPPGRAVRSTALPHRLYAGPYQPYMVRLPGPLTAPMPAVVYLHGRSSNHLQGLTDNFRNYDPPAMIVGTLGRGPQVGYGGVDWLGFIEPDGAYGEQDVLDVLADLSARGMIEAERVVLTGISMGGVGVNHFAALHPDLFAGAFSIVGGNGGILPGNWWSTVFENLISVRFRMANGAIDPLAHIGSQLGPVLLHALGDVDFRSWLAFRRHHEWSTGLESCVYTELLSNTRVTDPPRVVYSVNPAFEVRDATTGLNIEHTGAYWVSGLKLRADAEPVTSVVRAVTSPTAARIDVTTLARADRAFVGRRVAAVGQNVTEGADYCGPNPNVRTSDAWEMNGLVLEPGPDQPVANAMTLAMRGFSGTAVDLDRMGISITGPIVVSVTGDGTSTLTLLGPWIDGAPVTVVDRVSGAGPRVVYAEAGRLRLTDDFTGVHEYVLTP